MTSEELGKYLKESNLSSMEPLKREEIVRPYYNVDIIHKSDDLLYQFFPKNDDFPNDFKDKLGDAFLEIYRDNDKLCWDYVIELNSWVVRAMGFASNPFVSQLKYKLLEVLDNKLETKDAS